MRKLAIIFSLLILIFASLQTSVFARSDSQEVITIAAGEVIDEDVFAFADRVEVAGEVNGDVFALGGPVIISGKVNGDVLAAGGMLNISGEVTEDVRVAGGQVNVDGVIGQNLTVVGGNVNVSDTASVGENLVAGAGNVTLVGPVLGNVKVGAGILTLTGLVGGNVDAAVDLLKIKPSASVGGNLTYVSDEKAVIDDGARIQGEVVMRRLSRSGKSAQDAKTAFRSLFAAGRLMSMVSTLILGLLFVSFYPKSMNVAADIIKGRIWMSLGLGLVTIVLTPILIISLFVSILGIPLAFLLLATYMVVLYSSRIFVIFWLGRTILTRLKQKTTDVWTMVGGVIFYYFLTFIPVLGALLTFFAVLVGLGAGLLTKRKMYLKLKKSI
ncbi:MAG: hypothetical protein ACE5DQ_01750 [Candidatus Paceibacterota bacterium]